ncbi:MAG TPA: hypothetical protein VLL72_07415 [Kiloniellales bacterium]|nr:hypothetical protein [Kiloniellales bacterium]
MSYAPLLILALVGLVALAVVARRPRWLDFGRGSRCAWQGAPGEHAPAFARWRCADCGIEAYSTDGRPPKECKKALKTGL